MWWDYQLNIFGNLHQRQHLQISNPKSQNLYRIQLYTNICSLCYNIIIMNNLVNNYFTKSPLKNLSPQLLVKIFFLSYNTTQPKKEV